MTIPDHYAITGWTKLGGLLRDARKTQGLTQADVAAKAGVARSWLARVEAGHRGAELEALLRLIDALGLKLTLSGPPASAPSTTSAAPADTDTDTSTDTNTSRRPVGRPMATSAARSGRTRSLSTIPPPLKSYAALPGSAGEAMKSASSARRSAWALSASQETKS